MSSFSCSLSTAEGASVSQEAISVGLSRKGNWRFACTFATHSGMTIKWLKEQGLVSEKELWVNIYSPLADSLSYLMAR
jgi:hypothetical protein